MLLVALVESFSEDFLVFKEQALGVINFLEKMGSGVVHVGDLVLLAFEAHAHLFGSMVVVDLLEGFGFVNVGEDLAFVIQNVLDVNLSELVSFLIAKLAIHIILGDLCHFLITN